jgi:hypothetical protein
VYCLYTMLVAPKFLRSIKRSDLLRNKTSTFLREKSPNLQYYDADPSGRRLRLGSAAARLLGMGFRISRWTLFPLWMLCVSSGTGLCVRLITCPEESYRVWCIWVWSWSLAKKEALSRYGLLRRGEKNMIQTQYKIDNGKSHNRGVKAVIHT